MNADLWGVYLRRDGAPAPVYVIVRADNAADALEAAALSQAVGGLTAADFRPVIATRLPLVPEPVHVLQSRGVSAAQTVRRQPAIMPAATHRIEVVNDPHSAYNPWDARIYRLSDDSLRTVVSGETIQDAAQRAREWIARENDAATSGPTLYVDDHGQDAEQVTA